MKTLIVRGCYRGSFFLGLLVVLWMPYTPCFTSEAQKLYKQGNSSERTQPKPWDDPLGLEKMRMVWIDQGNDKFVGLGYVNVDSKSLFIAKNVVISVSDLPYFGSRVVVHSVDPRDAKIKTKFKIREIDPPLKYVKATQGIYFVGYADQGVGIFYRLEKIVLNGREEIPKKVLAVPTTQVDLNTFRWIVEIPAPPHLASRPELWKAGVEKEKPKKPRSALWKDPLGLEEMQVYWLDYGDKASGFGFAKKKNPRMFYVAKDVFINLPASGLPAVGYKTVKLPSVNKEIDPPLKYVRFFKDKYFAGYATGRVFFRWKDVILDQHAGEIPKGALSDPKARLKLSDFAFFLEIKAPRHLLSQPQCWKAKAKGEGAGK